MPKIYHIEREKEFIVKFTIWKQTFSLYPIEKQKNRFINKMTILFLKRNLRKALYNLSDKKWNHQNFIKTINE